MLAPLTRFSILLESLRPTIERIGATVLYQNGMHMFPFYGSTVVFIGAREHTTQPTVESEWTAVAVPEEYDGPGRLIFASQLLTVARERGIR